VTQLDGTVDRVPGEAQYGRVNNPLVPTPERDDMWWQCSFAAEGRRCDHMEQSPERPPDHDRHRGYRMEPVRH
jgi:hypothetical protein